MGQVTSALRRDVLPAFGRKWAGLRRGGIEVINIGDKANVSVVNVSAECGRVAVATSQKEIELAENGKVSRLVAAARHKEMFDAAGIQQAAHAKVLVADRVCRALAITHLHIAVAKFNAYADEFGIFGRQGIRMTSPIHRLATSHRIGALDPCPRVHC